MFGYVKPQNGDLLVKQAELYRAAYCGLCRSMRKRLGFFTSFSLSYDFAFLTVTRAAISEEKAELELRRCPVHPLKKRPSLKENATTDFCAAAARLLKFGGSFFCVFTPERLCDLLCALRAADLEPKRLVVVQNDEHHAPFAVLCEGKKGAKPSMRTEVLTLLAPDGTRTSRYAKIQDEGIWE